MLGRADTAEGKEPMTRFDRETPLLAQLERRGLQFDQQMRRALEVSATRDFDEPEDVGFSDAFLTMALYRLNTPLTRLLDLDESALNIYHDYRFSTRCPADEVVPGWHLLAVLNEAAAAAANGVIGVGHYLGAVAELGLAERGEPGTTQWTHDIFSVEALLAGTGRSLISKIDDAPEVVEALTSLQGENRVQDHEYLLTEERGRVVFRPRSFLGSFQILSQREGGSQLAYLNHPGDPYTPFTPPALLELEDLINSKSAKEKDLQAFFERNPHLLRLWEYRDVHPHVVLTHEDEGDLIPDFMLVDPELQKAMVLDLKLPHKRVVVGSKNRRHLAAPVQEAIAQVRRYGQWFEERGNRAKLKKRFGLEVYRPRLAVVIGRTCDFETAFERQALTDQSTGVKIVTYDDVATLARRRLTMVREAPLRSRHG